MKYEMMYPDQIRKAIDKNTPVVMALGVLEYHGEHMSPGVDTLLIIRALELIEKEVPIVILPPFYYGSSSFAVEPPERTGSINITPKVLYPFAGEMVYNLLRIGFRNIHIFVHHQSENFKKGMPTDLSFKLAARQEVFSFLNDERGEGWWGKKTSADYYSDHQSGEDPFNWVNIHSFLSEKAKQEFPIDHAGKQETSLMMALCPEAVDMERFDKEKWYCQSAESASLEYGNRAKSIILKDLKEKLTM